MIEKNYEANYVDRNVFGVHDCAKRVAVRNSYHFGFKTLKELKGFASKDGHFFKG